MLPGGRRGRETSLRIPAYMMSQEIDVDIVTLYEDASIPESSKACILKRLVLIGMLESYPSFLN